MALRVLAHADDVRFAAFENDESFFTQDWLYPCKRNGHFLHACEF